MSRIRNRLPGARTGPELDRTLEAAREVLAGLQRRGLGSRGLVGQV